MWLHEFSNIFTWFTSHMMGLGVRISSFVECSCDCWSGKANHCVYFKYREDMWDSVCVCCFTKFYVLGRWSVFTILFLCFWISLKDIQHARSLSITQSRVYSLKILTCISLDKKLQTGSDAVAVGWRVWSWAVTCSRISNQSMNCSPDFISVLTSKQYSKEIPMAMIYRRVTLRH